MINIIVFELKKIFKSLHFSILLIFLAFFIGIYFIYNYIEAEDVEEVIQEAENNIAVYKRGVDDLQAQIDSGEVDADDSDVVSDMEYYQKTVDEYQGRLDAAEHHDWNTLIQYYIDSTEKNLETDPTQKEDNISTWPTHFTNHVFYEHNKWLMERKIRPVFPVHLFSFVTVYDEVFDDEVIKQSVLNFHNVYSSSAVYFLYRLLITFLGLLTVIYMLFVFGGVLTKEGLNSQGTIHFLYTQPMKRGSVFFGKLIAVLLATVIILVGAAILSLLLGAIFDRFGALGYPVLIYEDDFGFHFMKMGLFILLSLSLFFMVLVFSYAWLFFYSVITKRTAMTIGLSIATILAGVKLSENAFESKFAAFNPFTYFQIEDVITMQAAYLGDNFQITLLNGVMLLAATSIVIYLVAFMIFKLSIRFSK